MFDAANAPVPETGEAPAKPAAKKRVTAVDAARCLALIGMMGVHVLPEEHASGDASLTWILFAGRASALFALLAGVSLAFSSGGSRPLAGRPLKAAMAGVAARAVVIMAFGMALAYAGPPVEIILAYYGVMFLLAVPVLGLTSRMLAILSVVFAIGGPILLQVVRGVIPAPEEDNNLTFGMLFTDPLASVGQLLFTGFYPAVPWMAYMCAGLAIGKLDLSSRRVGAWLAAGGAALAATAWAISGMLMVGVLHLAPGESAGLPAGEDPPVNEDSWAWLVAASPYSHMPLELLHTIGTGMLALGVLILAGKSLSQVISVLAPAGSMTLTLYSGHLLFLAAGLLGERPFASFGLQVAAALLFGVLWHNLVGRGPLEAAVTAVSTRVKNAVLGQDTARADQPGPEHPGPAGPSGP